MVDILSIGGSKQYNKLKTMEEDYRSCLHLLSDSDPDKNFDQRLLNCTILNLFFCSAENTEYLEVRCAMILGLPRRRNRSVLKKICDLFLKMKEQCLNVLKYKCTDPILQTMPQSLKNCLDKKKSFLFEILQNNSIQKYENIGRYIMSQKTKRNNKQLVTENIKSNVHNKNNFNHSQRTETEYSSVSQDLASEIGHSELKFDNHAHEMQKREVIVKRSKYKHHAKNLTEDSNKNMTEEYQQLMRNISIHR